ncbi:MAG: hypothetical protein AB7Q29_19220 [Vicinamibacterales bacterium]
MSESPESRPPLSPASPHKGAAIVGIVLFALLASAALTVDTPRTGPGLQGDIKGDEATYVAATLSAAFDRDLTFGARDLERFAGLFHRGPEGIFLKRGKQLRVRATASPPFLRVDRFEGGRTDRLYFAKALLYPVVAAPFVRVFGLNGLLFFHVVLLALLAVCGYLFLAEQTSSLNAALFTTAFLGVSALPVYGVFLTPELLNVSLVFAAYFLWTFKYVSSPARLTGAWPDVVAAVLLGLAMYSKPTNGVLIAPLVLAAWVSRRWWHGLAVAGTFAAAVAVGFGLTLAVTGEMNYQGGDRRTFYGSFPFDGGVSGWDERGSQVSTEGSAARDMLTSPELAGRFLTNVKYAIVGRHFGMVPFFFPGVLAIVVWLASPSRRDPWRIFTFAAFVGTAVALLLLMPYTWSGGGGPTGNRYLLSAYPTLFFLLPPMRSVWPSVLAWVGGGLFTAKILMNPFAAAKYPFLTTERGPLRRLPVELTMANDLPVMLAQPLRAHIPYGADPRMLLYFLDQNAFPPEPTGIWIGGGRKAEILIRTVNLLERMVVTAESPIRTTLRLSMGRGTVSVQLEPDQPVTVDVPVAGERGLESYAYLLTAQSSDGFVPHVRAPESSDYRNLGALIRLKGIEAGGN